MRDIVENKNSVTNSPSQQRTVVMRWYNYILLIAVVAFGIYSVICWNIKNFNGFALSGALFVLSNGFFFGSIVISSTLKS